MNTEITTSNGSWICQKCNRVFSNLMLECKYCNAEISKEKSSELPKFGDPFGHFETVEIREIKDYCDGGH